MWFHIVMFFNWDGYVQRSSDLFYTHMPCSSGCTLRGVENQNCEASEKDVNRNLYSGFPNDWFRVFDGFREQKVVFFDGPDFALHCLWTACSLNRIPSGQQCESNVTNI